MSVISLSIPPKLIENLEKIMEEEGYNNRSEIIRDAIRDYINEYKIERTGKGKIGGIISVMYPINDQKVSEQIQKLQHQNEERIEGVLHLHYDEENCFDILLIKGKTELIINLISELKTITGTKHIGTDLIPIE